MQHSVKPSSIGIDRHTVGHLAKPVPLLTGSTTCSALAELFQANTSLPAYAVQRVDGGYDLVDRATFLPRYLYGYNRDLFQRTPVTQFWTARSLTVAEDAQTEHVGITMTTEYPELLNSGFIITRNGEYAGVGLSIDLMRAIAVLAEEANIAKNTFLANMNHEIRTPLNAVIGNLELLSLGQLDTDQREFARMAKVSADVLLELIGELLDLSKIQAGRLEIEAIETNVRQLVDEVLTVVGPRARQKGLRVTARVASDVPETFTSDALRLRQVLINFLGNAVKFTESGGAFLTVRALDGPSGARLHFEVVDTGPGFDPAQADKLFEPFVQEDASTTRRFGGTGLGLAISKAIIGHLGGEVGCHAEWGLGATFWCTVPVPSAAAPRAASRLDGHLIWLVGENDDRSRVADHLMAQGASVLAEKPHGGKDTTLAIVAGALDTEAAIAHFSRLSNERTAPIVAAASASSAASRYRAHAAGADYFFRLPDELADIAELMVQRTELGADPVNLHAEPAKPFAELPGSTILVIDDTQTNRTLAERQLKVLGLDCETADNGQQGLDKAIAETHAAILVDASMPVMDGVEFIGRWREFEKSHGQARTPVIVMTGQALAGDAERFKALGADDYLAKPVTLGKLQAALQKWLRQYPPSTPAASSSPAASQSGSAIDLPALADMIGDSSLSGLRELLDVFLADFPDLLAGVSNALREGPAADIARAAHAAKSAAASACAKPLAELLAAIETQAAEPDKIKLEHLVAEAGAEFGRIRTQLAVEL